MEKKYGKKQLAAMVAEYLSNDYKDKQSTKCPNCSAFIQKSDGCNKMTCQKCGVNFCYLCGNRLGRINPYEHFNKPNTSCAGKLFLGVDPDGDDVWFDDFDEDVDSDDEFIDV